MPNNFSHWFLICVVWALIFFTCLIFAIVFIKEVSCILSIQKIEYWGVFWGFFFAVKSLLKLGSLEGGGGLWLLEMPDSLLRSKHTASNKRKTNRISWDKLNSTLSRFAAELFHRPLQNSIFWGLTLQKKQGTASETLPVGTNSMMFERKDGLQGFRFFSVMPQSVCINGFNTLVILVNPLHPRFAVLTAAGWLHRKPAVQGTGHVRCPQDRRAHCVWELESEGGADITWRLYGASGYVPSGAWWSADCVSCVWHNNVVLDHFFGYGSVEVDIV